MSKILDWIKYNELNPFVKWAIVFIIIWAAHQYILH